MAAKKTSTGKKVLKWGSISILTVLIILFTAPFIFKGKIEKMVTNAINKNINATVSFTETDLSFFTNFPLASLSVKEIAVINKAPFLGDTLYAANELNLSMKITELFKGADEALKLQSINTKDGFVNIYINNENNNNYDIAIQSNVEADSTQNSIALDIEDYELENMTFNYVDEISDIKLRVSEINHSGQGNFAQDILDLDTETTALLSLDYNKVNYLSDVNITLDAIIGIDLKNTKYTFKENKGFINQLPLEFDGFIQLIDENQLYDLQFKTPTSDFKNLIALLSQQYSGNLASIKTEGNFDLNGVVKGTLSDETIPTFNILFSSKNAMFKYNDLPNAVNQINIDAKIINNTGLANDTYVDVNKLTFKIDDDTFAANGNIANLTTNPTVNLNAKGTVNLAKLSQVYPVQLEQDLAGIVNANVSTSFDMNSIEKGVYKNIKNSGAIIVSDFKYDAADVANPFLISKTALNFNTNTIQLNEFKAKTGSSDLNISGNLNNFYGFLFNDEVLKGNFNLSSNNFKVADFLSEPTTEQNSKSTNSSTLKIPAFLDCKFIASANSVTYDNINLKNVSGIIYVKDETINLQNLNSDVFGGKIGFNGNVSTKNNASTFKVDLDLKELNIKESFSSLEMLESIAPIANTVGGKINSKVNVSGVLDENMAPSLKTITGNLFGKLINPKLTAENSKLLQVLSNNVSFLDAERLDLDGINAYFSFDNGVVNIKPIPLKYKDVGIEIYGNHTFENSIDYKVNFDVPVKYLGSDVTSIIAKLNPKDAAEIKSIPVKATITGNFTSPNFSTNLKTATSNLVKELVEKQKQSLLNQGKDKLKDLLNTNSDKTDSIKTTDKDDTKDKIKNTLKSFFNRKKDTTKSN
ncbi:AsmA-like C-terminal region-containing protein [Polaribacter sp. P097]|uniref:AsmA-like C-terminal region-containing protein n=1 Tax=Polaribacter sp. P097 TaxID=3117398 RepID=UPI002FE1D2CD